MSLVDQLKSHIEKSESLRDELRSKTIDLKYLRSNIRELRNDLQKKTDQISELENKSDLFQKKAFIKSIPHQELEYYQSIFNIKIAPMFSNVSTGSKIPKTQINVVFLSSKISFFVSLNDTFLTLRKQVCSYWALPMDEVYFSDTSPEEGPQAIFMLTDNIVKELYVWKNSRLKNHNFDLYVVLKDYSSLEDRIEKIFPRSLCDDPFGGHTELDIDTNDRIKKKKGKENNVDYAKAFINRKIWHKAQYGMQWFLYLGLFLMWVFILAEDHEPKKIALMNKAITDKLMLNYSFDNQEDFNIFGKNNDEFFAITSVDEMWGFILNLQEKLTSNDIGVLNNNIYILKYVEIRQLRTSFASCSYEGLLNYTCSGMYSFLNKDEKSFGKNNYQIYTDRDNLNYIYADFSVYPNSGFINHVDIEDDVGWEKNISNLIKSGWFDGGTRAVFITINFYTPDFEIFSMLTLYVEILPSQVFVKGFKLYSFKAHVYTGGRVIVHMFIFIFIIMLLVLEVKQNIRHPKEVQAFIYEKNTAEIEKIFEEINEYSKKTIFWKLKKPGIDNLFSILTLIATLLLEIISLSMYLGQLNDPIGIQWSYMNFYGLYQQLSMLNDAKCLATLFLSLNMTRYIIIWLAKVNDLFRVVLKVFSQVGYYVFLALMPIFLFSILFFYYIGEFDYNFSTLERSFISIIRIFCGKWPSDKTVLYFIDSSFLALLITTFFIWRMVVISLQSTIFEQSLTKIMIQKDRNPSLK